MSEQTPAPADAGIKIAFASALATVRKVPKDADNPYFKSKYQSLDGIQEMLKPILQEQGLTYSQHVDYIPEGQCVAVTTMLWDGYGTSLNLGVTRLPVPKLTPQDAGSAFSYAKRYALGALFAIQTGEDTDAETNMAPLRQAPARAEKPAPQSKPAPSNNGKTKFEDSDGKIVWVDFVLKNRGWTLNDMSVVQLTHGAYTESYPETVKTLCQKELLKRVAAGDAEAEAAVNDNAQ